MAHGDDWPDDSYDDEQPMRFRRLKLGSMTPADLHDPQLLCDGLLYEQGFHSIAGEPDSGKTTIAYWFAAQLIEQGHRIMVIDEEQGPRMSRQKFSALGVDAAELDDQVFYVPYPRRQWTAADNVALGLEVDDFKPMLTIFDSASAMLSFANKDENKPAEVVGWFSRTLLPLTRRDDGHRTAVLLIDHDTKAPSGGRNANADRYARGSGGKLAAIDVQLKVKLIQPFSRHMDGQVALTVTKDREGFIHPRRHRLDITRKLRISYLSQADVLAADSEEIIENLSITEGRIYQVLDGTPLRKQEIANRVIKRWKSNVQLGTVGKAMAKLVDYGVAVIAEEGGGRGLERTWIRAGSHQQAMVEA